jgi:hypothetical protein
MDTMKPILQNRLAYLALGIGLGLGVGWFIRPIEPSITVNASATQGMDNFAIATGLIEGGVEGLYFLDYLTGDLKAGVISEKNGKFNALFQRNVAKDFGAVQNPKYLLVTGLADIPRGRSYTQLAKSIIYVAEASTGRVAAYAMPWNSSFQSAGKAQQGEIQLLDIGQFRTVIVREQP